MATVNYSNAAYWEAGDARSDLVIADGTGIETATLLQALPAVVALSSLDGVNGFRIPGLAANDLAGDSVAIAGDVNGDGLADFIIGAPSAGPNGRAWSGESYVVFGRTDGFQASFDLASLNGSNGFRLQGDGINYYSGNMVAGAGDINGDGFADIIVSPSQSGPNAAGSYVIFGHAGSFAATIDLAALPAGSGFHIVGGNRSGYAPTAASAGDINGDGFDDLVIGVPRGTSSSGEAYVIFGHGGAFGGTIDISALNGTTGFRIDGPASKSGDSLGSGVSAAGDINGDGIADLLIAASDATGQAGNSGSAYVIFGRVGSYGATLDLGSLNGANGFRLEGIRANDYVSEVAAIGDVNGDGYDDILIGAKGASPGGAQSAGEVYVVFGHAGGFAADISLASLNGANGFRIAGVSAFDTLGTSVSGAGDFNGDGLADFIISAPYADPSGRSAAGSTYVVFGRAGESAATFDLATLNGANGFRIDGNNVQDWSGSAVAGGGDINGDGYDDIIVGVFREAVNGKTHAGESYVIYGRPSAADAPIVGSSGDDLLSGTPHADTIMGLGGNDVIDGLGGADQLYGGTGNDTYYVDRADDLVFENAGEGSDTVIASAGFYLYANIENLTLAAGAGDIFGVGNELANVITGNEGSNLLIAGAGADIVHGSGGVDSIFGQDGNDQLYGDAGVDYLVGGNGDDMLDGGTGADALYGEDGNDILWGGTDFATDILVGGAGNDVLHGDSGLGDYDLMDGGSGDDTYYVDTPADLTFEAVGGGTDMVHANIVGAGYYLYANVENLILDGITPFGVGNELNNQLTGNAIGNYLLGGAGDDILNGKGGNDVLFGESGTDTFVFEHGTGADVIGDFTAGTDRIDLTAIGYTWQQVQNSLHENGGNTAIDLGGGDLVVLNGVAMSSLNASDFILVGGTSAIATAATHALGVEGFQVASVVSSDRQGAATDTPAIGHPPLAHIWALDLANDNGVLHVQWHDNITMPIDAVAI
ncbi:hypothetical protein BH10PSE14_BH10PSE14_17950 [soil metagenome]